MNRAQRRRLERDLGRKRSDKKRGRRGSIRAPLAPGVSGTWRPPKQPDDFEALHKSGFVVMQPEIVRPGSARGDVGSGLAQP